jgi:ribonuclease HII
LAVLLKPTFKEERLFQTYGYNLVAGVDEVGRGALAGPVFAAAVILPVSFKGAWKKEIRDSKQLDAEKREELSPQIHKVAISVGIGTVDHDVIDEMGVGNACLLAMKQAIEKLNPAPQAILVDYFQIPGLTTQQKGVADGDSLVFSIACASIIAKVARDHLMVELDKTYTGYGLADHKGYSTKEHLECLRKLGPCSIHRRSFQPVREAIRET